MPFAEEDYSRKPKDKLWFDGEEMDFCLPKVLIDNTVVVALVSKQKRSTWRTKTHKDTDNFLV
jgi:hypothetical protein